MPEYKQGGIARELEERILDGRYHDKLPPVNLLADEFQVNIRTMTKALSLLVRQGLIAKKRGIGAFVTGRRPQPPHILVNYFHRPDPISQSTYHSAILDGIRAGAAAAGPCELSIVSRFTGDLSQYDGVLFLNHHVDYHYDALFERKQPFVVLENLPAPEFSTVCANVHATLYQTLLRAIHAGYRKIAYVGMTTSRQLFTDVAKFHAWLEATDDALHEIDFNLVRHVWPLPENSYAAVNDILRHTVPDAVFVTSDLMAEGVYRALSEHGLRIPEDVGVLGCDGLGLDLQPGLATIAVPRYELGRRAIMLLLDLIREPGRRRITKLRLPTEFIPGASLPPTHEPNRTGSGSGFVPPPIEEEPRRRPAAPEKIRHSVPPAPIGD